MTSKLLSSIRLEPMIAIGSLQLLSPNESTSWQGLGLLIVLTPDTVISIDNVTVATLPSGIYDMAIRRDNGYNAQFLQRIQIENIPLAASNSDTDCESKVNTAALLIGAIIGASAGFAASVIITSIAGVLVSIFGTPLAGIPVATAVFAVATPLLVAGGVITAEAIAAVILPTIRNAYCS